MNENNVNLGKNSKTDRKFKKENLLVFDFRKIDTGSPAYPSKLDQHRILQGIYLSQHSCLC